MSYALHIWEKPADRPWPATVEEADRLLSALRGVKQGQNPKFIALAQRLTGRYPCIMSPQAEALPESELAWSDGPLNGRTDKAVFGIGVRTEMLDEVRPFVVEQANAMGLNVLDQQAGEVFLSVGKVLSAGSAPAPAPAQKNYEDVPTRKALEQAVFDGLVPIMQKHGFKPRKTDRTFKQVFPGGRHVAHLATQDGWPLDCEFRLDVVSRFDAITDLIAAILHPGLSPDQLKEWPTTVLGQNKWLDNASELVQGVNRPYRITSYSQIDTAMHHLSSNIEARLIPILEKSKTIEGLDALLNTTPIDSSVFFTVYQQADRHIIAAHLVANPRLDAICDEFLSRVKAEKDRAPILCCIEYVRKQRAR